MSSVPLATTRARICDQSSPFSAHAAIVLGCQRAGTNITDIISRIGASNYLIDEYGRRSRKPFKVPGPDRGRRKVVSPPLLVNDRVHAKMNAKGVVTAAAAGVVTQFRQLRNTSWPARVVRLR